MLKSEWRSRYKSKRKSLSPHELSERSYSVIDRLLSNVQVEGKTVSMFLPIEKHKEMNTYSLLERIVAINGKVALPVSDFEKQEMVHYLYEEGKTHLKLNQFGIPEPQGGKIIAPVNFDIVLVPLLMIDKEGNRVGYGKGFYDRFLSLCREDCFFVGLHLFELEENAKIVDVSPDDIPLDAVVTPTAFIRF